MVKYVNFIGYNLGKIAPKRTGNVILLLVEFPL